MGTRLKVKWRVCVSIGGGTRGRGELSEAKEARQTWQGCSEEG